MSKQLLKTLVILPSTTLSCSSFSFTIIVVMYISISVAVAIPILGKSTGLDTIENIPTLINRFT
mgnify:CR=1 FL=1